MTFGTEADRVLREIGIKEKAPIALREIDPEKMKNVVVDVMKEIGSVQK